jgi:hypothetical protein
MRVHSRRCLLHFAFSQGLLLTILSCAFLLSATQTVYACSCGPTPTVLDSFDQAQRVVIVRVLSVEKGEDTVHT